MNQEKLTKVVRSVLFAVGSLLVAAGKITPQESSQLPEIFVSLMGAGLAAWSFVGSILSKPSEIAKQAAGTVSQAIKNWITLK